VIEASVARCPRCIEDVRAEVCAQGGAEGIIRSRLSTSPNIILPTTRLRRCATPTYRQRPTTQPPSVCNSRSQLVVVYVVGYLSAEGGRRHRGENRRDSCRERVFETGEQEGNVVVAYRRAQEILIRYEQPELKAWDLWLRSRFKLVSGAQSKLSLC
jgi:hypothetical protein